MEATTPAHSLSYMTFVDGDTYIPISLTAIVAFGFVSAALLVNAKPGAASPAGAWDTPAGADTESRLGGRTLLLLYRLYSFGHLLSVLVGMSRRRGLMILYFYTNWSFVLEVFYFLIASLASCLSLRGNSSKPSGRVGRLGVFVVTLFHVTITATLIVDLLHWGVLWPMLSRASDPAKRNHFSRQTFSWVSYNTHILNFVFMLGDLMLNKIPLHSYLLGYVGLYSSFYALWAFSVYTRTKHWIYPFLNASKPWAVYVYAGIYVGHWLIFGLTVALFRLRDRILGTSLAQAVPAVSSEQDKED